MAHGQGPGTGGLRRIVLAGLIALCATSMTRLCLAPCTCRVPAMNKLLKLDAQHRAQGVRTQGIT